MFRSYLVCYLLSPLMCLSLAVNSSAQDHYVRKLYGAGVHAFHDGAYQRAHSLFSTSIDRGNTDPRCFYFRGVASRRMGRADEAAYDFQLGAQLEAKLGYSVATSLQRIQGADRLVLKQYRDQISSAKRLAARLRKRRNMSPGELLPAYESQVRARQATEVPAGSDLVSRDPSNPYSGDQFVLDEDSPPSIDTPEEASAEMVAQSTESQDEFSGLDEVTAADTSEGEEIFGDLGDGAGDFAEDARDQVAADTGDFSEDALDELTTESTDDTFDLDSLVSPTAEDDSTASGPAAGGGGPLRSIFRALRKAATPPVDLSQIPTQLPFEVPGTNQGPGGPPDFGPGVAPSEFDSGDGPGDFEVEGDPFQDDPL